MKKTLHLFIIALSLYASVCQGQEVTSVTNNILEINPNHMPVLNNYIGYLENTDISIGTIIKSHHFKKYSRQDYNESHKGLYINVNEWSVGTYTNSSAQQSVFVTHNTNVYRKNSFAVNIVAGVASGYETWKYAQDDYLPILGASTQWAYLKAILSHNVVAFGIELPLN
ncbi:MAG: hypothetical protein GY820_15265 [Gammaproteobacteria bacterium]|nr:hypothetical protein [Gammaproteobacteria bacterium]